MTTGASMAAETGPSSGDRPSTGGDRPPIRRPHGSAAGIPEPPRDRPAGTTLPGGHPRGRRTGGRPLLLLLVVAVAASVIVVALANRSSGSSSAIDALAVGDCFVAPEDATFAPSSIDEVDCAQPHNYEVYATGITTSAINTAVGAEQNPEIVRICRTDVAPGILAALARTPGVTPGVLTSTGKPGRLVCTAHTEQRTGSLTDAAAAA